MSDDLEQLSEKQLLHRMARELTTIRQLMSKAVNDVVEAESEIPEKMRRFAQYAHDVHDLKFMYEEHGTAVPDYIMVELRRVDDRYRQLLSELHAAGGTFDKVRREMATDKMNRYDHTRQIAAPTHTKESQ